jgi:hypothetical protein
MKRSLHKGFLLASLLVLGWVVTGCQSPESENLSSRPWNSPRGWEHGLPSSLNEGR